MNQTSISIISALLLSLVGCGSSENIHTNQETNNDNQQDNHSENQANTNGAIKTYQAVVSVGYAPFEFVDDHGKIIGYDIDLLNAVGEEAGFKVEFNNIPFLQILHELGEGHYDIGMSSGFVISEEYKDKFKISNPYVRSEAGFWVKTDSPFVKESDLKDKVISVQQGSNFQKMLEQRNIDTVLPEISSFLAFQSMLQGKADANTEEQSIMIYRINQHPDYPVRFIGFDDKVIRERVIVSASDNNKEIIEAFNRGLKAIKENGKYQQINEKWFKHHANDIAID